MIAQKQASWRNDKVNLRECKENRTNESHPAGGQEDCPEALRPYFACAQGMVISDSDNSAFSEMEDAFY